LLAFYDFPAEHWQHLRTTNAIESTFATVRHRTARARNCVSRPTLLGLAFKLIEEAEKIWRRINGPEQIKLLLEQVNRRSSSTSRREREAMRPVVERPVGDASLRRRVIRSKEALKPFGYPKIRSFKMSVTDAVPRISGVSRYRTSAGLFRARSGICQSKSLRSIWALRSTGDPKTGGSGAPQPRLQAST
jgi:hypothetical protein